MFARPTLSDRTSPGRRAILFGASLGVASSLAAGASQAQDAGPQDTGASSLLAAIEQASGGRMGVHVRDTGSGAQLQHRSGERFPMCSTFKALMTARVLDGVDHGRFSLDDRIAYGRKDLLETSPVTIKHADEGGMRLGDLCAAIVEYSDNTAANLILRHIGGPAALTAWLRGQGDAVTRLDRYELALNSAIPGDPRDTTTPAAYAATFEKLTVGPALKPASRGHLQAWLAANTTGAERLRAGLPRGWAIGDKTGSNGADTANDIGLIRPPGRAPIVAAVFVTRATSQDAANAAIAKTARVISHWVDRHG